MLVNAYREEVAPVIGLYCQLEQVLCVVIEWMALGQVARPSRDQQTIDGIKPAAKQAGSL